MNIFLSVQLLLGLGAEPKELTFLQISLRGVIVFFAALVMVLLASLLPFLPTNPKRVRETFS